MLGNFDPAVFLPRLMALVIAIAVHEFAHAITADKLGDHLARSQGRVTLNPVAHFDPLGFMLLLFLAAFGAGFAWGRPVPVNPYALRGGRRGMALVAIAGPLSNLIQAAIAVAILRMVGLDFGNGSMARFLGLYIVMNIYLAAFNMLPVPPLDGFNVLTGVVSNFWVQRLEPLRQSGPALLLVVVFIAFPYVNRYAISPMVGLFAWLVGAGGLV